jgi:uncharacterized protein Usg
VRLMSNLSLQLRGYRLTTAEIIYHMPDHPGVLQSFVWQSFDIAPDFPMLQKFLRFWSSNIDGKLHSVKVGSASLVTAGELRHTTQLSLH